jgi:hypothetical protein
MRAESGDKRSRGRCTYLGCIAGEDHDDIVVSKFEGSEDTAQRAFSRIAIRDGTINPR